MVWLRVCHGVLAAILVGSSSRPPTPCMQTPPSAPCRACHRGVPASPPLTRTPSVPRPSVVFNFLGRDFFNALSERDAEAFQRQLLLYLGGFAVGIPIIVISDYFQVSSQSAMVHDCYSSCCSPMSCDNAAEANQDLGPYMR